MVDRLNAGQCQLVSLVADRHFIGHNILNQPVLCTRFVKNGRSSASRILGIFIRTVFRRLIINRSIQTIIESLERFHIHKKVQTVIITGYFTSIMFGTVQRIIISFRVDIFCILAIRIIYLRQWRTGNKIIKVTILTILFCHRIRRIDTETNPFSNFKVQIQS